MEQEKHLRLWLFECKEPSHDAFVLGVAAASLLAIAHVLANLLGGCSVCATDDIKQASPSRKLSMACLVFTWYLFNSFVYQSMSRGKLKQKYYQGVILLQKRKEIILFETESFFFVIYFGFSYYEMFETLDLIFHKVKEYYSRLYIKRTLNDSFLRLDMIKHHACVQDWTSET